MEELFVGWGMPAGLGALAATWIARIAGVIAALLVAIAVGAWARGAALRAMRRAKVDETLARFLATAVRWAILIATIVGCLGVFGFETTTFAAVLGAASLAIGLAFQGSLSNVAAGVMLLLFRPYKVGDVITVAGQTGAVDEISLFTTTLDTPDRRRFIVPNAQAFGQVIENKNYHPIRRVDVSVGVGYGADIDRTREVLAGALARVENTLAEPPPAIALTGLGQSSVDWAVRVFVNTPDYWVVYEALTRSIKLALDEAGIDIPYPQRVIHNASA